MNLNRQSGWVGAKSTRPGQILLIRILFAIQTFQKS